MDILILITGGTLDKVHDTATEALIFDPSGESHITELLRIGRGHLPRQQVIMMKDSLAMTEDDRAQILDVVKAAPENHIVITHGTGTMAQTARYLEAALDEACKKTIVLTGAMRPFSLGKSDAGFNLGGAIIAAQTLPAGIYAVMNGRVFKAGELRKDVKRGRFD